MLKFSPKIFSVLLLALCALAVWQLTGIQSPAYVTGVGPRAVPLGLVVLLAVLCLLYAVQAWRGKEDDELEDDPPLPGGAVRTLWLLAGAVIPILLLKPLGFVIPMTLCGVGVAVAFDAHWKRPKTYVICALNALVMWLLFAKLLGVDLGPWIAL